MADKEPFGYQKPTLDDSQLADKLERVDELVSLMLDDELDNDRVTELEGLLLDSSQARQQYVGMVQLHVDLIEYYNPKSAIASPVLAALNTDIASAESTEPAP